MKLHLVCLIVAFIKYGECLPDSFPSCKRNDPDIEKCILQGIEDIKPKLKNGIPEINLPPLDPFKLDLLVINSTVTGAKIKSIVTNVVAYGASEFDIKYLKINLDGKYEADLEIVLPFITVTADYNTRGSKMLFVSINGSGKFKGSFKNMSVIAKCVAVPVTKEGKDYLQLDSIVTKVSIEEADLDVNPVEWSLSGTAASSFIKSSPNVVLNLIAPVIDEVSATLVKKYVNDVLSTVPLDEVLLDE